MAILQYKNFNSIKVQLERNTPTRYQTAPTFQFHKGTIRTWVFRIPRTQQSRNFNSIKVQLEPKLLFRCCASLSYFNSIKVQLELDKLFHTIWMFKFQFHKGTIRTPSLFLSSFLVFLFQFHKGTIRTSNTNGLAVYRPISIP